MKRIGRNPLPQQAPFKYHDIDTRELTGLKIRGFNIDILVRGQKYNVNIDDQAITSEVGVPVLFRIRDKKLKKLNLPHN